MMYLLNYRSLTEIDYKESYQIGVKIIIGVYCLLTRINKWKSSKLIPFNIVQDVVSVSIRRSVILRQVLQMMVKVFSLARICLHLKTEQIYKSMIVQFGDMWKHAYNFRFERRLSLPLLHCLPVNLLEEWVSFDLLLPLLLVPQSLSRVFGHELKILS